MNLYAQSQVWTVRPIINIKQSTMFNGFITPSTRVNTNATRVTLKDRIYGIGFNPDAPVRLTQISGHKITSAQVVLKNGVDHLGNPFTKPVVVLNLEGTTGYGIRSYWSNTPAGATIKERELDVNKLVEFSASQDGVAHSDNYGDPIMYCTDEEPKAHQEL